MGAFDLDGRQLELFRDALVEAFPSRNAFESLLLGTDLISNLNAEVGEAEGLNAVVFEVLKLVRAEGALERLFTGAMRRKARNPKLQALAQELGRSIVTGAHEYLSQATFDLRIQEEAWSRKLAERLECRLVTFVLVECSQEALDNLVARLWNSLDPGGQPITRKVTLRPLITSAQEAIDRAVKWRPALEKNHLVGVVLAEGAGAPVLTRFLAEVRTAYAGTLERHLVLIVNVDRDWPVDAHCARLDTPKFEDWHLNEWVTNITRNKGWPPALIAQFADWIVRMAKCEGELTIGGAYDALQRAIELLAMDPDEQTLRQSIAGGP